MTTFLNLVNYFLAAGNTGVFLDVDDFPIPKHLDPKSIYQKIKRALENKGYRTHVSLRLYGDKYAEAGIKICLVPDGELYIFFTYFFSVDIYS